MKSKLFITIASFIGACLIYCGEKAINSNGEPVGDAEANSLPNTFTLIQESKLTEQRPYSDPIDVSQYQEVVLFLSDCQHNGKVGMVFTPNNKVIDGTAYYSAEMPSGVRVPIVGPQVSMVYHPFAGGECKYYLAGIK